MAKEKPKPGPKPDELILEGPWEERVRESLHKKRPEGGWPKPGKAARRKKPRKGS